MSAARVILAALVFGTASAKPAPVAPAEPFSLTGTIVGVAGTIHDIIDKIPILSDVQGLALSLLEKTKDWVCLLYTSPSPRDGLLSRMPSSA